MRKLQMLGWMFGAVATAAGSVTLDIDRTSGNRPPVDLSAGKIRLEKIGGYSTGLFDEGGAEIAAYSRTAKRLFFVNAQANAVQALDLSDPAHPVALFTVDFAAYGGGVNSVATWGDLAAAACFSPATRRSVTPETAEATTPTRSASAAPATRSATPRLTSSIASRSRVDSAGRSSSPM